jgi:hypothetical protein
VGQSLSFFDLWFLSSFNSLLLPSVLFLDFLSLGPYLLVSIINSSVVILDARSGVEVGRLRDNQGWLGQVRGISQDHQSVYFSICQSLYSPNSIVKFSKNF